MHIIYFWMQQKFRWQEVLHRKNKYEYQVQV